MLPDIKPSKYCPPVDMTLIYSYSFPHPHDHHPPPPQHTHTHILSPSPSPSPSSSPSSSIYILQFVLCPPVQVEGSRSITKVLRDLLKKEGPMALGKGLHASILSWVPSSVVMICGYETIKKFSLKEQDS